jgi:hypothetical protein
MAAGVAVLLIGAFLFMRPYATRDRDVIASTPATAGVFMPLVPIEVKPGDELCLVNFPLDSESKLARLRASTFGKPGAPLAVSASAPNGYRFDGRHPGGYRDGPLELAIRPPAKSVDGQICLRNTGTNKIGIQATQVGQRFSRPRPWLNGGVLEQDVPLTMLDRGKKSLIQQTPRAIDHAAVFVPLAPWAIWVLLVLTVVGVPAGVYFALARAAALPAAVVADVSPTAPPVPFPRARRSVHRGAASIGRAARRAPPGVWLGLLVLAVLAFGYLWASRMGTFQNDEGQNVYFARWMANNLPDSLWDFSLLQRGLQRAEIYVLALMLGLFKTPTAFLLAHFVNVAAWVSAAIPAYLLVRGLGVRAAWALIAALLTIAGPWLVFSVSFLTEPLAYPAAVWLLWAVWRAVVDPRPATEITALVVLFVALLTRSAFLILIPLLPAAVFLQELRYGGFRGGWRATAARLWSRHAVLLVLCGVGVLVLLLSVAGLMPGPGRLTGSYGTPFSVIWEPFLEKTALYASRVVVGTGFLPFAVGLPWIVAQLIRPDDERTHAFVVTAALLILLVVYASSPAGPDERYVIYFGPPLIVAATVALARGRLAWPWVAAGGLLGAVLIYKHGWNPEGGAYGFFIGPGETFYARVGLLHLQDYVPQGITVQKAAFLVALGATAVCAYAFMRRSASRVVLLALVFGLVLLQVAQAEYTTTKFVTQGGERFGTPHKQRAWVDEAIYGKSTAAIVALSLGNTTAYDPIWAEIQFWNTSVNSEFAAQGLQVQLPPGDYPGQILFDGTHSRPQIQSENRLPQYAVIPRGFVDLGLAGTPVAHATYVPADLVKLDQPVRVVFQASGIQPDGFLGPAEKGNIRFLADGSPQCGIVPLTPPVDAANHKRLVRYELGKTKGQVRSGETVNARVPLDFKDRPYVDVPLSSDAHVKLPDNRVEAIQVGQISVGPC